MRQQLTSRPLRAGPPRPHGGGALRAARAAGALLVLAAATATAADAQSVLGAGAGAFVVPRGVLRVGVDQRWSSHDETFGVTGVTGDSGTARVPLGARLSSEALGTRELAPLAGVERDLRALTGQGGLSLSLGRALVSASADSRTTALGLEAGLGAGISVGVVVPVVRTLSTVSVQANEAGGAANVGLNPARYDANAASAAATNAAVTSQFAAAARQLRQQYPSCFTSAGASTGADGCADAVALHESATTYATTLARVYGTEAAAGAAVVPVAGSAVQRGVDAAIAAFSARFATLLGTTAGPITGSVQGAAPATDANLRTLLSDPAGSFALDSLRSRSRITLGDVEVGVRLRLLDTFRGREQRRLVPAGLNLRTTVAGTFRFGTGHLDSPNDLTDVATGDGQSDVEVASLTDVVLGSRGWLSLVARYGRQLADEQPARIPFAGAGAYLPAFTLQTVQRDLGDYVAFEATPRVAVGRALLVEAQYRFRRKQADAYTGTFPVADSLGGSAGRVLDAASLAVESEQQEQQAGAGVTYSTYEAFGRRRSGLPLELSLSYLRTLSGRGGVPAAGVTQLQLRAFPRLFGADWRAPRAAPPGAR